MILRVMEVYLSIETSTVPGGPIDPLYNITPNAQTNPVFVLLLSEID